MSVAATRNPVAALKGFATEFGINCSSGIPATDPEVARKGGGGGPEAS